jgi:hypothetical protein
MDAMNQEAWNNRRDRMDKAFLKSLGNGSINLPVTPIEALRSNPKGVQAGWDRFLERGNIDNLTSLNSQNTGNSSALSAAGVTLLAFPEPITSVIGAGILAGVATYAIFNSFNNNPYPKPWSTDRPNNYIPTTPTGPGNHNVPNGAKAIVGGALVYKLYKKYKETVPNLPNPAPVDNTYYYIQAPPTINKLPK